MQTTQDYIKKDVRTAAILTTSYVAGTVIESTHLKNQLVVYVDFTIGSLTTAELRVEFSHDNSDWYQETAQAMSSGTATETVMEHQFGATGKFRLIIPTKDKFIRISAKGTGTVTGSSMAVDAIIGIA